MGMKHFKAYTPSRRNMTVSDYAEVTKKTPEKSLLAKKKKNAGRNSYGRITVRHQGGGNRQKYRIIDFKRIKDEIDVTKIDCKVGDEVIIDGNPVYIDENIERIYV